MRSDDHPSRLDPVGALYPWYVAGLMGLAYAVSFVDRSLVGVAGAPIMQDLGLTDSQFGLLHGTAFVALYCLCGIPLGLLADRTDRRAMIALGILFWSGMTVLCGLAGSFATFFIARIGVGLGEASLVPAGMSLLGGVMRPDRMARAVAIFLMGAALGNGAALVIGGTLLTALDQAGAASPWRLLFLFAALPGLVMAAWVMTLREPARAPATPGALGGALRQIGAHREAYGLLTAATACTVMLAQAPGAWVPLFYVRHFGLQPGASALLIGTLFLIAAPAGQLAGGMLADRWHAQGIAGAPNLVMALCVLLALGPAMAFCTTDRQSLSEASYLLFTFLVSAATPTGLAGLQLLTPLRYRGVMSALLVSVATLIGVGLGPVVVGLLTDHVFRGEAALGRSLLCVILAAGLAGPLFALAGRRSFARGMCRT